MNQPLLQKPTSQQEPEPLQRVFRAVKSTCQTVGGKKNKIQKNPVPFKAAEGRGRELSFPAGFHTELSAAEFPPGSIKTEQGFSFCVNSGTPWPGEAVGVSGCACSYH